MTLNHSFFDRRMIREKLAHNTWMITLFSVLCFFALPVPMVYGVQHLIEAKAEGTARELQYAKAFLQNVVGTQNIFVSLLLCMMAVVAATAMFRYMHQKKQVDFYHSLPIKRTTLFGSSYTAGLLTAAMAYLGNLAVALLIGLCGGGAGAIGAGAVLKALVMNIVVFLAVYAIVILAHQMAGTMVTGLCCTGVFLAVPPAFVGIWLIYMNRVYDTFYAAGNVVRRAFSAASPVGQLVVWVLEPGGRWWPGALGWFLFAGCCSALALWMYCQRPSESTGKAVAFRAPASAVKYLTVLLVTLCAGELFRVLGYNHQNGWMIFGFVCGAVLSYCLIEIIYHLDFKQIFCHWKGLLAFGAVFALCFTLFQKNAERYNHYLPKEGSLSAVYLDIDAFDGLFRNESNWVKEMSDEERTLRYAEKSLTNAKITDQQAIDAALKLAQMNFDGDSKTEEVTENSAPQSSAFGIFGSYSSGITICYEKENGRKIYRQYHGIQWADALPYFKTIYDSAEYRRYLYPLYALGTAQIKTAAIYDTIASQNNYAGFLRGEEARLLADTLLSELEQVKAEQMTTQVPVTYVDFSWDEEYGKDENETTDRQRLPVYAECAKTLAILKNSGIWKETQILPEDVEIAYVINEDYSWEDIEKYSGYQNMKLPDTKDAFYQEVPVTDPEKIAQLLKNAVSEEMNELNPFFLRDPLKTRFLMEQMNGRSYTAVYPAGQFPTGALAK